MTATFSAVRQPDPEDRSRAPDIPKPPESRRISFQHITLHMYVLTKTNDSKCAPTDSGQKNVPPFLPLRKNKSDPAYGQGTYHRRQQQLRGLLARIIAWKDTK
ncbi:MAG: hypothetical protein ACLUEV_09410 [Alistipes sp.]